MRSPSKKAIQDAFPEITTEVVAEFKHLLDKDLILSALRHMDSHMDGSFGLEYTRSKQDTWASPMGIEYINTGDTYNTTLYWDMTTNSIMLGSWGDRVEKYPRRFQDAE
jgi:hypothetical protein